MPQISNWDEFTEKANEMYNTDPTNTRVTMKYRHSDGKLTLKMTDNKKVYQFCASHPKEVKNIDKFVSNLMRGMV